MFIGAGDQKAGEGWSVAKASPASIHFVNVWDIFFVLIDIWHFSQAWNLQDLIAVKSMIHQE